MDKRLGLIDAINRRAPDPRNQFFIAHQQRTMLAQMILFMAIREKRFFHGYYDNYFFLPLRQADGRKILIVCVGKGAMREQCAESGASI